MTEVRAETQLIERARDGDRSAIRKLYERHSERVLSTVYRFTGDEESARDCAQEVWIRAIRALPSFREEARFSTWLHRIAINTALQISRSEGRKRRKECAILDSFAQSGDPGDALLARSLEEALNRIPGRMREVLILHDVEGYTHREIAELLGVTAGTSKSQLFKARARMREVLCPPEYGEHSLEQREGVEA